MKKNIITAIILGTASFLVYLFTMPPSVYTGDSGEIATAVYVWGVAHPTGFPTYIISAKLFSYFLPWFEFAFRLNIFSAACGALTVAIVFLIFAKLKINFWPAVAASLSLAFGFTFWSHAATLQVYTLTAFFFALAIFIFLHWLETQKPRHLYLLALVSGIGAGTHLSFILIVPFLLIFALLKALRKEFPLNSIKHIFFSLLLGLTAAFAVYAYIPLRAAQNPELNWGDPSTKESFINYITQRDYSDKIGTRSFESWGPMSGEVGKIFSREFTWFGLFFILIGMAVAFKKNRPFFYAGVSVIFFNILLLGNYGNNQDIMILWRYFLPSYIIMAIFIAYALSVISTPLSVIPATCPAKLKERSGKAGIQFLLLPAIIFAAHFGALDRHDNVLVQNAARDIFNSVPQGAILIVDGDTLVGGTMYEQTVLKKRQDIILISDKLFTYPWYQEAKKKELEAKGKKYADNISYLIKDNASTEFFTISNASQFLKINYDFYSQGLVYRILGKKELIKFADVMEKNESFWKDYDLEFLKNKRLAKDYFTDELVKVYVGDLNNLAAYFTNNGDVPGGIKYFEKSLEIRENKNALYNLAGIYNALGDKQKALEYKDRFGALK